MNYKTSEKLRYDKQQMVFLNGRISENKNAYAIKALIINFNEKVLCPFCLNFELFSLFSKKGNLYTCPKCENKVMLKTLYNVRKMTAQDFAKWVFEYRLSGFFDKINFQEWNKKLFDVCFGFGFDFWEEYKKLKGERKQQQSEDY
jgi:hypothetical protein